MDGLRQFISSLQSSPTRDRLKPKVIIVTGAGTGLGQALSVGFAYEGATVIGISRSQKHLEGTESVVKKLGKSFYPQAADIKSFSDCENAVSRALEFGHLDVLVNCAGVHGPLGPYTKSSLNNWDDAVQTNILGTAKMIRASLVPMVRQKSGKIINIAGGGALNNRPYFSAYASSKAAIVRLTEVLATELKESNVSINVISPGPMNTRLMDEIIKAGEKVGAAELSKAKEVKSGKGTPFIQPFNLCMFLLTETSKSLSGKAISAVWDDIGLIRENIVRIQTTDIYTMRRVTLASSHKRLGSERCKSNA